MKALKQINAGGLKFVTRLFISTWQDIGKSSERYNPIRFLQFFRIRLLLTMADHPQVIRVATSLHSRGSQTALLYTATSNLLMGRMDSAESEVRELLNHHKGHAEASYLLSSILTRKGEIKQAKQILQGVTRSSRIMKPWIMLSNLVDDAESYREFCSAIMDAKQQNRIGNNSVMLTKCMTNAALRSNQHNELEQILQTPHHTTGKRLLRHRFLAWAQDNFPAEFGKQALEHVDDVLRRNSIEHFLISGTLLGCIREGALLPHDRDLDIGVWIEDGIDAVSRALLTSGYFYPVETRSKELLKLKHVTGIAIDIFFHRRNPDEITHAGVKTVWRNAPFRLKEIRFLGRKYLIPEDPERYLTENYGDWRTTKIEFDCALDTPNSTVYNQAEMDVYAQLKILAGHQRSPEYQRLISKQFINTKQNNSHNGRN